MSMAYIRKTYGVPAKRGGRVVYTDTAGRKTQGVITGTEAGGLFLRVRLDGWSYSSGLHPTKRIEYLPDAQSGGEG